ncbi:MAG: rane protein [Alphaproteobacteria bacterium]|nr:rane protein [Alphaproteobacteria bacterium]
MQERRIHELFQVSVLLKGAHALIECVGGITLAVTANRTIAALINRLTQDELIEGRADFIARHLVAWAQGFSVQAQHFYAFYLLSHGVVKLALVAGLLMRKLWAYPASLVVMSLFIAYQLYRYSWSHSIGLIVLSLFDVLVIGLIWHEYRLLRRHLPLE